MEEQSSSDTSMAPKHITADATLPAENSERLVIRSQKLGNDYVRIRVPSVQTLRWSSKGNGTGQLEGIEQETPSEQRTALHASAPAVSQQSKNAGLSSVTLPGLESRVTLPGTRPGNTYVRRRFPLAPNFRGRGGNVLEASELTLAPHSAVGRGYERIRRVLLGRRLATAEQIHERLTKVKALAVLSSDAISSVAYGTEASLGILITAGLGVLSYNLAIGAIIVLLMVIVGTSYWQTIHAYPHGGGSYIVARDNLGDWPGLIAAAALLIDYVLTVSVSVSAGIDALVSATPALSNYAVPLGVACICFIMFINLRGIRESGTIFAAPTYLFVGAFLLMILTGVVHAALSPGGLLTAVPPTTPPFASPARGGLGWAPSQFGILLILTAFASGCSAMTGVEAISNGVPAFKAPEAHNASRTLATMIAILATLYLGTTYLSWRFGLEPNPASNPTLDSQIASMLFVGPFRWFYFVVQYATLLILTLAANTSFADFPRLSSILARDGFLPHQFAFRGDRLAFSTGILVLSVLSSILLVVFQGHTDALINLYALGVFTAFTLSQSGMVIRWLRLREIAGKRWRQSLLINGFGATATGVVTIIIGVSKFDRGAWIVVILVPLLVLLFRGISKHYAKVREQTAALTPLKAEELRHVMVVPIAELNQPALQSLAYARSLSPHVVALHISSDEGDEATIRAEWERWVETRLEDVSQILQAVDALHKQPEEPGQLPKRVKLEKAVSLRRAPQLVIVESPYRSLVPPLIAYVNALRDANGGTTVSVILPEFVPAHWWELLLHNQTALRLKLALYSDPGVVVVNVPYLLPR